MRGRQEGGENGPFLILGIFQSNGPNFVRFLVFYSKKCLASRQEFGFSFLMHLNICREAKLLAPQVLPYRHFGVLSPLKFEH